MSEKILSPQLPELSDQDVFDLILDCVAISPKIKR